MKTKTAKEEFLEKYGDRFPKKDLERIWKNVCEAMRKHFELPAQMLEKIISEMEAEAKPDRKAIKGMKSILRSMKTY